MDIIRTDEELETALERINKLIDSKYGTPEGRELDRLVSLVELYERDRFNEEDKDGYRVRV